MPKLLGAKVILDLHDPMPELMQTIFKLPENSLACVVLKRLEKWSIRFADLVITVNLACKKIYSSRSCQPNKIKVVINSPDDEMFRMRRGGICDGNGKNGNGSKPFVILYHGSLVQPEWFRPGSGIIGERKENNSICAATCLWEANRVFRESDGIGPDNAAWTEVSIISASCNVKEIVEAIKRCDFGNHPQSPQYFH